MTTPIDSSSPFAGNTVSSNGPKETTADVNDFPIRTMQDDLLELQKKTELSKNASPVETPKKIIPTSAPITEPPKKAPEPKDMASSQIVHPFVQQVVAPKKKELIEVPVPVKALPDKKTIETSPKSAVYKIASIVLVVIVIVAMALGSYYFLIKHKPANTETAQPAPVEQQETTPLTTDVTTEKYSTEKPNYLSMDITTFSPEDIQKTIAGVAEELKSTSNSQASYEFIVVDANNNPIAFPIFATAAKINLTSSILNALGETFSLFIFNDNGNMRLSLAADITKKDTLASALLKQEKTFITDASFLFLGEKPETTVGTFQDNTEYKDVAVRFLNVNSQKTLSIDYAILNNQLVIGTSKNTMRAVLDKLSSQVGKISSNISVSTTSDPKEAYLKMRTEADSIKSYADLEAYDLKYGTKENITKIKSSQAQLDTIPETIKDGMVAITKGPLSTEITDIQVATSNNNTATLNIKTSKPALTGVATLALENNIWKVSAETWTDKSKLQTNVPAQ